MSRGGAELTTLPKRRAENLVVDGFEPKELGMVEHIEEIESKLKVQRFLERDSLQYGAVPVGYGIAIALIAPGDEFAARAVYSKERFACIHGTLGNIKISIITLYFPAGFGAAIASSEIFGVSPRHA